MSYSFRGAYLFKGTKHVLYKALIKDIIRQDDWTILLRLFGYPIFLVCSAVFLSYIIGIGSNDVSNNCTAADNQTLAAATIMHDCVSKKLDGKACKYSFNRHRSPPCNLE